MELYEEIMKENIEEQDEIRSYLLGILSDQAKARQIEESLLLEDRFAEKLLIAEEKLIEEYLDNTLDQAQQERFDQFFLSTPQGRQQLRLTQNFRRYAAKVKAKKDKKITFGSILSMFSSPLPVAAGAAAIILLSFFSWLVFFRFSDTDRITAFLNRAYKLQRPFESRVSGLDYAAVGDTRGEDRPKVDRWELEKAERLSDSASNQETAESLRNEGRVFLVKGEFDRAIESLEKAKKLEPQNAWAWNDLGVAQLEKAKSLPDEAKKANLELKTEAVANFDKAIELDPNLLAAYFNRALCLQAIPLPGQAREAWQEYLKRDPESSWAGEARKNLELIGSNEPQSKTADDILQEFMAAYREKNDAEAYRVVSHNREMITGKLVPQRLAFLFLTSAGADRQEYLAALNYTGRLEKERSGDPYVSDIARYYSSVATEKQAILREAQEAVNQGYSLCLRNNFREALDHFTNARDRFSRAGNIWEAGICDYWIGYCLYQGKKIGESTQTLSELADFAQSKGYKWLTAQAFSWLAINMVPAREFSRAIEYNNNALQLSTETSDSYLSEKCYSQVADVHRRMGNHSQAKDSVYKALELASQPEASPRQKVRDYNAAADMCFLKKNLSAASAFKKEALDLALAQNEKTFIFDTYTGLGFISGTRGRYKEAYEFFEKAGKPRKDLQMKS